MLLVTGGTGFIGGHLLERLSNTGTPARCLVRRECPLPPGIQAALGDLASGAGLSAALEDVDTVIHLAGVTKALRPQNYYTGNVQASRNLADALRGRAVRFVHVSSLAAVGPSLDGQPVSVDAAPHPLTAYGKSKLEAEQIVRERVPDAVVLRPAVVYGPRDTDVFQMLQSIADGLMVQIAGPERWFSAIYVEDLVDALLAAACSRRISRRALFLAHPEPVSWTEFGKTAARLMNRTPRVLRVPPSLARLAGYCAEIRGRITRRPGILSRDKVAEACCTHWTCDTASTSRELGFEARTSLAEGLGRTLAWYKEAGWLKY
jgi:nucleoside-diphosphate-sugar epimerase